MAYINPPNNLDLQTFRALIDGHEGIASPSRFMVRFNLTGTRLTPSLLAGRGIVRDLSYLCEITDMPGRSFDTFPVRYYGPNQALPLNTNYDTIDMQFICRNKRLERNFFDTWMEEVNPVGTYDFNYVDEYCATIDILNLHLSGSEGTNAPSVEYWIRLHKAWPTQILEQPLSWGSQDHEVLGVRFSYHKWTREGTSDDKTQFDYDIVRGRQNTRLGDIPR